jgi:hypothetical protein
VASAWHPFSPSSSNAYPHVTPLPTEATPDVVARVGGMSAATVDRCLAPYRARFPGKGRGMTKPGTLLKGQIPIRFYGCSLSVEVHFLPMNRVRPFSFSRLHNSSYASRAL